MQGRGNDAKKKERIGRKSRFEWAKEVVERKGGRKEEKRTKQAGEERIKKARKERTIESRKGKENKF
jgi:hypothetical protein